MEAIQTLRTFFRISNAAFNLKKQILISISGYYLPTSMEVYHQIALQEIEKENPNMQLMDRLLAIMESIASEASKESKPLKTTQ